ncbi:D-alanyl-D-alanine carboxypeptidase family protein [uncultured Streptomyces sp.]|uniref:D-alanyl-D-alanine carboxypeptidase family protein n=1 Tax=uncultured Streptomyces sp. TaxID=174707 RepID=UPI0026111FA8|nr:serine hydrolase [uncultured Streptomyces sp.]
MAGESPGKSEQRKSSGTAPEERDPRLAVFREPDRPQTARDEASGTDGDEGPESDANATETAAAGTAGRPDASEGSDAPDASDASAAVDAAEASDASAASGAPETPAGTEAPETPGSGEAGGPAAGSGADTATAVFRAPLATSEGDASDGEASGASVGRGAASEGASDAAEAPATAGEPSEAAAGGPEGTRAGETPAEASGAPARSAAPEEAAGAGSPATDGGKPAGADAGDGDGTGSGNDGRLRAAVAAWVATADDKPAGDAQADDAPADDAPAGGAPADDEQAGEDAAATADADAPAGEQPAATPNPAKVPRTREETAPADDGARDSGGPDGSDAPDEHNASGEDGAPGEDDASVDPPTAVFAAVGRGAKAPKGAAGGAAVAATATGGDSEPTTAPGTPDADRADADRADLADADRAGAGPDDADRPDRPTTAFKAVRPPRIDQPTTALKLPRSDPGAGGSAAPESPSERTSTFVPLRSDDVRPAGPPRRAAPEGVAAIGPTVTPSLDRPAASGAPTPPAEAERTRQQPLPPKPPLDLLAELTNTPPPPETPVRTAVRRVKIWTPLVLLLLIVFALVQTFRPLPDPELRLTAQSSYRFDGSTPELPWPSQGQGYMAATGLGKVGGFGEQKPVPIASVAKAMTAYIVLKDHPLKRGEDGASIPVDAKGESDGKLNSEGESTLDTVEEGDKLSQKDALSAIMIPSANNIARLLARWDAGSEKAFVEKMNTTAEELGMKNTTYTDPSGLNATTVSTAEDLVKLGEKLVEIPALMDITKLPSWTDPSGKVWTNYNRLVPYDGALGIKTGSTTKAGGNLLFAAHKMVDGTDQLIVGAILGQYDSQSIIDEVNRVSKDVMLATQDELKGATIVKKGQVVGVVDDGLGSTTEVVATKDVKAVGWGGLTVRLEITDDGRTVPHEAAAGTHVGTLTVGEGASQVQVAVALADDLGEPGFGAKLKRLG